jgi:hypothetical protein
MGKKRQIEMERMIVFKAPKEFAEKLEAYCKANGYSISYAVRKAVEQHILTPEFTWLEIGKWLRLNLILTFTTLERNAHIYQMFKLLFKVLNQQDIAEKIAEDEATLRTHLDQIATELKKWLKEQEELEMLKRLKALKEEPS